MKRKIRVHDRVIYDILSVLILLCAFNVHTEMLYSSLVAIASTYIHNKKTLIPNNKKKKKPAKKHKPQKKIQRIFFNDKKKKRTIIKQNT